MIAGLFFVISTPFSFGQFAEATLNPTINRLRWHLDDVKDIMISLMSDVPNFSQLTLSSGLRLNPDATEWCNFISDIEHHSLQLRSSELSPQSSSPSHLHLSGMQRWLSQRKSPLGSQGSSSRGEAGTWNWLSLKTTEFDLVYLF